MDKIKIKIVGDIAPIGINENLFINKNAERLFSGFHDLLAQSDLAIANIECPLTDTCKPIRKLGINLKASTKCIKGIKLSCISLASLANNHIMDYGVSGLKDTMSLFSNAAISTIGAGTDRNDAAKPFIKRIRGFTIAVLSAADREFSEFSLDAGGGANNIDIIKLNNDIQNIKKRADFIIVLLHRGVELYPYPSPGLQRLCRFLIEVGANIIICQHSHVIGSFETYKNGLIVYGQGNFIFQARKYTRAWFTGLLVNLEIDPIKKSFRHDFIPFEQDFNKGGLKPPNETDTEAILSGFFNRSEELKDENAIKFRWQKFCSDIRPNYIFNYRFPNFAFNNKYFNYLSNKIANMMPQLSLSKNNTMWNLQMIRCEDHREIAETILKDIIKEK